MKHLPTGKVPIDVLSRTVLRLTGAGSDKVSTPPLPGLDFAAIKVDSGYMLVSADPVTGVVRDIGRYAMCVSANDIATSGNRPQFAESVVLLPEGAGSDYVGRIARQLHVEAARLGVNIVGGHTEVTSGLSRPIVVVTAFSFVERYVTSRDARAGDMIMLTKTAGIEGAAVLTGSRRFPDEISVVEEAAAAFATGHVHAMHDCTEGGVLGAVFEMSVASDLGFEIREESVPVGPKTSDICRKLSLDPLRLIGSGALLLSVEPGKEAEVSDALAHVCTVTTIGRFRRVGRVLVRKDDSRQIVKEAPEDELWRVLSRTAARQNRLRG